MDRAFPVSVFNISKTSFEGACLEIFQFQYRNNSIYKAFTDQLGINPKSVNAIQAIPFLPIEFFKSFAVQTTRFSPEVIFESSGTSQSIPTKHYVKDLSIYQRSFLSGFEQFYGPVNEYCILGLLPSYLERSGSSLVMMTDQLIRLSGHARSGFYLYDFEKLASVLQELELAGQKTLLIGVTFALIDFAEQFSLKLRHTIIMETGGMKGRRREMTRAEVHELLKLRLGLQSVHSEYGMTELLSQAYSKGEGLFKPVPWMRVLARNEEDPLEVNLSGNGIANIIDLANFYSCSFIATDDICKVHNDDSFEISGRMDNSDLRGCSLLAV